MMALVWKEWRENRPWFFAFLAWMLFAAVYSIGYEWGWQLHASIGGFYGWMRGYTTLAAILLAMRVSQGEQSAGTLGFTVAIPSSLRQVAGLRITGAMLTLIVPLLVGALVMTIAFSAGWIEQGEPRAAIYHTRLPERLVAPLPVALEQLASVTAIAVVGGLQWLLLLSCLGYRLRSQAQAGFLGAVLVICTTILTELPWTIAPRPSWHAAFGALFPSSLAISWGYGTEEGGHYIDHELVPARWWTLAFVTLVLMAMTLWFVLQYGRVRKPREVMKSPSRWSKIPSILARMPVPTSSRWGAMVWLELRQSLPLAFYGLALAITLAFLMTCFEPVPAGGQPAALLRGALPQTMAMIGMIWPVVVGSGIFAGDLREKLGEFWRSRPISPRGWFWCKYVTGLAAVLLALDGTVMLVSWDAPNEMMEMSWAYVACFPILHALSYSIAMLSTCWIRKPVAGGLVAIVSFGVVMTSIATFPGLGSVDPFSTYGELYILEEELGIDLTQFNYIPIYGTLVVVTGLIAWAASRLAAPLEPVWRWRAFGA
jgi:hypothetical protein